MIKSRTIIVLLLMMVLILGCVSREQARRLFVQERDYDMGRNIVEVPLPPPNKIEPIDNDTSAFVYETRHTGCRFSYVIDNKTKRVRSWQFLSDPDLCYLEFGGV